MSDAINLDEHPFKFSINTDECEKTDETLDANNAATSKQQPTATASISFDSSQVSTWLDNHPEFLNDYLKKLQMQRRSSIMNDKSGTLLANLHSNLRMQTQLIDFNQTNTPNSSEANNISRLSTPSLFYSNKDSDSNYQTPILNKAISVNYACNKKESYLFNSNSNLNLSISEPSLPPLLLDKYYQFLPSSRKYFKNLSLYEKMYTLVKTLYHSLDLKTTCKKILNTVSLLLDADRCSLFLVIDDEKAAECKKSLVSVVFDAQSNESIQAAQERMQADSIKLDGEILCDGNDEDDANIRIPYGKGIAGYVASTGQALNIQDAYEDARFNSTIDQITGYKTKSVLCLPILNEHGECIAVAEAINKSPDDSDEANTESVVAFTEQDEEIFSKFMPFIAIAIRNSNLYTQSRKEAQTNKVLLELATIVFDESSTTVDNLVSRILFNSLFLLECEKCQVILLNTTNSNRTTNTRRHSTVNKWFDRVYELNYNDLSSNEAFSFGVLVKPNSFHESYSNIEIEILHSVIESGEIYNIQNLKDDPKYKQLYQTNHTNSLICIPVTNSTDQVVALIYACNKIKTAALNYFSQSDINVAQAFALFCGIGIQNIMMYEKVVRALNMQQVALDVLSYHVSSSQEEVNRLAEEPIVEPIELGLLSFSFDENTLDNMGTLKACISMFADLGLIEKFNIPYEVLCRFFLTVKKNYRPVAYHNWRHGFNVMSSMYAILTTGNYRQVFNDLEILSLLIACICHDLDHRGTTNKFQIKIQSPLAKLYTTSTMEHHHFNQCIIILHNNVKNLIEF